MNKISENELKNFFDRLDDLEREMEIEAKQDKFLELYHNWLNSNDPSLKETVNELAKELMSLDPSFKFKLLS